MDLGLRGVKLHPDFQRFEADSEKAMHIFGLCEAAGLPVLVHTGDHRFDCSNPNRIVNVLRTFPKLKFVGAHFDGWSVWDDAVRMTISPLTHPPLSMRWAVIEAGN